MFIRFFLKCFAVSLLASILTPLQLRADEVPDKTTKFLWFPAERTPAKGVVIVVHGLNNHPAVMDPLIASLTDAGFHALRVCLTGHCADKPQNEVRAKDWQQDINQAVHIAKDRYPDAPLVNLSYSLGAAVTLAYLREQPSPVFNRMVFLAPAITLRRLCSLIYPLLPLRALHVALPSLTPKADRAHDWLAVRMYRELFRVVDSNRKSFEQKSAAAADIVNIPTLSITHEDDELIDGNSLPAWIKDHGLTNWQTTLLPTSYKMTTRKHLLFDPKAVTREQWQELTGNVLRFISPDSSQQNAENYFNDRPQLANERGRGDR